jgi:hypothetical protein
MPITALEGLTALIQHPRTFLKSHLLNVMQFVGNSDTRTVKFQTSGFDGGQRYGSILGRHNMHGAQDFMFSPAVNMGYHSMDVQVQFVQMYTYAGLGAVPWHPLTATGPGSPNIMITTKLTGCSFLVRVNAGVVECAHIQPNAGAIPPQTGQALRHTLSAAHAGGYAGLFGRGRSGNKGYEAQEGATVVGIRRNNAWNIYAQRLVAGQQTFKDVERIYPR